MTSFDDVFEAFFDVIEEDTEFFTYFENSESEALSIAKQRSSNYLREAISYLKSQCVPQVQMGVDMDNEELTFDATDDEIILIAKIMYLMYLKRDMVKLKTRINMFSSSDLKALHSPANERNSFMSMVNQYEERCLDEISNYAMRDRLTGACKPIIEV